MPEVAAGFVKASYQRASKTEPVQLAIWAGLTQGGHGDPVDVAKAIERTIQVHGILSGTSVLIEGSLDGEHFYVLSDTEGLLLRIRQTGLMVLRQPVCFIRPRLIGGSPETLVSIFLLTRSQR